MVQDRRFRPSGSLVLLVLALATVWVGVDTVEGAPVPRTFPQASPSGGPRPRGACLGILVDGRPGRYGPEKLTLDLQQMPRLVPPGWRLDAIQTVGDMDFLVGARSLQASLGAARGLPPGLPVFLALGNHELDNSGDLDVVRQRFATYPNWNKRPGPAGSRHTTYSYDLGEMHVAVLNQYYDGRTESARTSDGHWLADVSDPLFDWLKADLRSSRQRYKLVVGHAPAFPGYRHLGDSLDRNPAHRDRFWSLLQTEGVAAYLSAHDHQWQFQEHDGVYEFDAGATGAVAGKAPGDGDLYPTLGYALADRSGLALRMVMASIPRWSAPSTMFTRTLPDLQQQILVNTGERAGSRGRYWVDYDVTVEANPDWSRRCGGRWWEPSFDAVGAGWKAGELGVGHSPVPCGWINTPVPADPRRSGKGHVRAIFQRIPFRVRERVDGGRLVLGLDGSLAVTAWLNGRKIYQSASSPRLDAGAVFDRVARGKGAASWKPGRSPRFRTVDVSAHVAALRRGSENVLALATWSDGSGQGAVATAARLTLHRPLPRRWAAYVDCGGSSPHRGVTVINRAHPWGHFVDRRTGLETAVGMTFFGPELTSLAEDCGAQVAEGPSFLYPSKGTPAWTEFLAPDGRSATVDLAWALRAPAGRSIVATAFNLDPGRTYTLVALGVRRRFNGADARFAAFRLAGVRKATPSSPPGVARPDPLTAVYNAGGNFEEGLVAKWTGIVPSGRSFTLTVTGVAHAGQPAGEAWLSALKLVEEK